MPETLQKLLEEARKAKGEIINSYSDEFIKWENRIWLIRFELAKYNQSRLDSDV